jgi:hypothetical protein
MTFQNGTAHTDRQHINIISYVINISLLSESRLQVMTRSALEFSCAAAASVSRCKNLTYVQLQLAAAVLAPVTLAAHQLLYSLWSLASFVTTPLEQAALTFLPAARSTHAFLFLFPAPSLSSPTLALVAPLSVYTAQITQHSQYGCLPSATST